MTKKIFLIAGEASGDLLGSKLIKELKSQLAAKNQSAEFIGVGGRLMQEQGLISIFPMEELSVMGFAEIIPHLKKILRRIKQTAEVIIKEKPHYVITIDSPDFCFRVMKKLQNFRATKKVHLIAPSVWAYRENRAEKISKFYNLLLAILPFEPPFFEKHGLKTVFIGHPVTENAPDLNKKEAANLDFRKKYSIKENDAVICITPGSRNSEVKRIFPEFIGAVNLLSEKFSNLKVVIPLVEKTRELVCEMAENLKVDYFLVENDEKNSALFAANFALAKSGTNTIELSLYHLPMIIAYKFNYVTHWMLKRMIKVKFANLVNLILNKEVIPEMIQDKCDAGKIAVLLEGLISDKNHAQRQVIESAAALKIMGLGGKESPSHKAASEILKL